MATATFHPAAYTGNDDLNSCRTALTLFYVHRWGNLSDVPAPEASSASLIAMKTEDSFRHLAFHHVCFALASSVGHKSFRHSEQHTSEAYVNAHFPRTYETLADMVYLSYSLSAHVCS